LVRETGLDFQALDAPSVSAVLACHGHAIHYGFFKSSFPFMESKNDHPKDDRLLIGAGNRTFSRGLDGRSVRRL